MEAIFLQRRFPDAFVRGVKAKLRGKDLDSNPFTRACSPSIPTEHKAFESGFTEAHPYERRNETG